MHKQVMSPTPPLWGCVLAGWGQEKNLFARNCMKYPDLQRNIMYETLNPLGWSVGNLKMSLLGGQVQKIFLLENA